MLPDCEYMITLSMKEYWYSSIS